MSDIESQMQNQIWEKVMATVLMLMLWILLLQTNTISETDEKKPQQTPDESQKLMIQEKPVQQAQQIPLTAVVTTSVNAETVVKKAEVKKKTVAKAKAEVKVKVDTETKKQVTASLIHYDIDKMPYWKDNIKGTDKWDALIIEISREKGIDPVFLKCIMAIESGGYQKTLNTKNKNGTHDYGLMQVNTSWGDRFDYSQMLSDPKYAISCGADVVLCKIARAKALGLKPTAFNVFWLYNGYSSQGKKYAKKVSVIYNAFESKNAEDNITIS